MEGRSIDWLLAFMGGGILTIMISANSLLAKHNSPLFASWVAYGVGSVAAFFLIIFCSRMFRSSVADTLPSHQRLKIPLWVYLGGIPGALTVVLASITVNSNLAFAGSFALMLVGQVLFGICSDAWGLFGTPKRNFFLKDFFGVLLVLMGSGVIIFFRL